MQFIGKVFVEKLRSNMDGKGCCRDNIFIERLWRSLKYEEIYLKSYDSMREAKISIGNYFSFYNHISLHQALKY